MTAKGDHFGERLPLCEPAWYQGFPSPYYTEGHKKHRAACRKFVEEELKPHLEEWIEKKEYPQALYARALELGVLRRPKALGGNDEWDAFYELITLDELARTGGANVLGQASINSMALPPVINYASDKIKNLIVDDVASGRKNLCLAISEPGAGSDVSNIQAKAVKEGNFYVVSGFKKWITGGMTGDYFTTAVRTGGKGMGGISLLLIDRKLPGITIRRMNTQFDNSYSTTFITFDKVKVPCDMLIGKENQGFRYLMYNFNHERFVISVGACRMARLCYEEAFKYSLVRKTFGKRLIDHQLVRFKLAEMARQTEALQDFNERVAYAFQQGIPDHELGMQCALLKVQASKTFEYCAREASQIFGGSSIVKEGKGKLVERMYREVRGTAIPGGSEEILLDFAMRQASAKASKM